FADGSICPRSRQRDVGANPALGRRATEKRTGRIFCSFRSLVERENDTLGGRRLHLWSDGQRVQPGASPGGRQEGFRFDLGADDILAESRSLRLLCIGWLCRRVTRQDRKSVV